MSTSYNILLRALRASTLIMAIAIGVCSCDKQKAGDPLAGSGRTQRTGDLLANLRHQLETGYMFGHHDDTVYGIGWCGDSCRSDIKSVCNDFPAVISFDLGHLELGDSVNLDGVPFDRIRQEVINQYERGGVVSLSWHLDNPLSGGTSWVADSLKYIETKTVEAVLEGGKKHDVMLAWIDKVADFITSLETPYGVKVPVIFRPWHEHNGSWFWWGQDHSTPDQYKQLWKMTYDRMNDKGVTNALYAYSPGAGPIKGEAEYMERYPGDDIVDIMGLDKYCQKDADSTAINDYVTSTQTLMTLLETLASKHNKVPAFTETGCEGLEVADWWTGCLAESLKDAKIAYVLVWRNAHDKENHFFAPYPGQKSAEDFVKFYNDPKTLFAHDVNGLYLSKAK